MPQLHRGRLRHLWGLVHGMLMACPCPEPAVQVVDVDDFDWPPSLSLADCEDICLAAAGGDAGQDVVTECAADCSTDWYPPTDTASHEEGYSCDVSCVVTTEVDCE